MKGVYTLGDWVIAEGSEDEFVEAWSELVDWTMDEIPGGTFAKLLRDSDDPRRFVSFGPWRDVDAVIAWRANPGFQQRADRLRGLADSVQLRMLTVEVEKGAATPNPW